MSERILWDIGPCGPIVVTLPDPVPLAREAAALRGRRGQAGEQDHYDWDTTIRRIQGYPSISPDRIENAHTEVMPFGPGAGKPIWHSEARRGAYLLTIKEARLFDPSVKESDVCFGGVLQKNPKTGKLESYFVRLPDGDGIDRIIVQSTVPIIRAHVQLRADFSSPVEMIPIKPDADPSERVMTNGIVFSTAATWAEGQRFGLGRALDSKQYGRVRCVFSREEAEAETKESGGDMRQLELKLTQAQRRKVLERFAPLGQGPGKRELHHYHTFQRNCMADAMHVLRTALEDDLPMIRRMASKTMFRTTPALAWILKAWGIKFQELPRLNQEMAGRDAKAEGPL